MTRRSLLVLLVLTVGASGCVSLGALFDPPEVSLADLQIDDMTAFETTGAMLVRITNPNPDPVVVEGGAYSLSIDGVRVGRALADGRLEIPGLSSGVQEAELTLSHLALATRVSSALELQRFDYEIRAKLYLGASLRRRVKVRHRGTFDLRAPGADVSVSAVPFAGR